MDDHLLAFQVKLFLSEFRKCHQNHAVYYGDLNRKTTNYLREIGWTYENMKNFILRQLKPSDYFRGLNEHHFLPNRTVAEFALQLEETQLYIKLELISEDQHFVAGYLSCHPAEKPVTHFPLKKGAD